MTSKNCDYVIPTKLSMLNGLMVTCILQLFFKNYNNVLRSETRLNLHNVVFSWDTESYMTS